MIMNAQDQASIHHQNGNGEGSSTATTTTTTSSSSQSISTFPTLPFFTNASAFHSAFHQIATAASAGKSIAAAAASIGDGQQATAAAQAYEWLAKEMLCQNGMLPENHKKTMNECNYDFPGLS